MLAEKKMLDLNVIETQSAVELPDRTLPLVTIVITNLLNNLSVEVDVRNNNVAVQVCAIVAALNAQTGTALLCEIEQ